MTTQASMTDAEKQLYEYAEKYKKLLEKSRKASKNARQKRKKAGMKDFALISFDIDRKAMQMPENFRPFVCYAPESYITKLKNNRQIAVISIENNAPVLKVFKAQCKNEVKQNANNSASVQSTASVNVKPAENSQTHIQTTTTTTTTTHQPTENKQ